MGSTGQAGGLGSGGIPPQENSDVFQKEIAGRQDGEKKQEEAQTEVSTAKLGARAVVTLSTLPPNHPICTPAVKSSALLQSASQQNEAMETGRTATCEKFYATSQTSNSIGLNLQAKIEKLQSEITTLEAHPHTKQNAIPKKLELSASQLLQNEAKELISIQKSVVQTMNSNGRIGSKVSALHEQIDKLKSIDPQKLSPQAKKIYAETTKLTSSALDACDVGLGHECIKRSQNPFETSQKITQSKSEVESLQKWVTEASQAKGQKSVSQIPTPPQTQAATAQIRLASNPDLQHCKIAKEALEPHPHIAQQVLHIEQVIPGFLHVANAAKETLKSLAESISTGKTTRSEEIEAYVDTIARLETKLESLEGSIQEHSSSKTKDQVLNYVTEWKAKVSEFKSTLENLRACPETTYGKLAECETAVLAHLEAAEKNPRQAGLSIHLALSALKEKTAQLENSRTTLDTASQNICDTKLGNLGDTLIAKASKLLKLTKAEEQMLESLVNGSRSISSITSKNDQETLTALLSKQLTAGRHGFPGKYASLDTLLVLLESSPLLNDTVTSKLAGILSEYKTTSGFEGKKSFISQCGEFKKQLQAFQMADQARTAFLHSSREEMGVDNRAYHFQKTVDSLNELRKLAPNDERVRDAEKLLKSITNANFLTLTSAKQKLADKLLEGKIPDPTDAETPQRIAVVLSHEMAKVLHGPESQREVALNTIVTITKTLKSNPELEGRVNTFMQTQSKTLNPPQFLALITAQPLQYLYKSPEREQLTSLVQQVNELAKTVPRTSDALKKMEAAMTQFDDLVNNLKKDNPALNELRIPYENFGFSWATEGQQIISEAVKSLAKLDKIDDLKKAMSQTKQTIMGLYPPSITRKIFSPSESFLKAFETLEKNDAHQNKEQARAYSSLVFPELCATLIELAGDTYQKSEDSRVRKLINRLELSGHPMSAKLGQVYSDFELRVRDKSDQILIKEAASRLTEIFDGLNSRIREFTAVKEAISKIDINAEAESAIVNDLNVALEVGSSMWNQLLALEAPPPSTTLSLEELAKKDIKSMTLYELKQYQTLAKDISPEQGRDIKNRMIQLVVQLTEKHGLETVTKILSNEASLSLCTSLKKAAENLTTYRDNLPNLSKEDMEKLKTYFAGARTSFAGKNLGEDPKEVLSAAINTIPHLLTFSMTLSLKEVLQNTKDPGEHTRLMNLFYQINELVK